jgi:hypothetical protein
LAIAVSLTLWTALSVQAFAVILTRSGIGQNWLRRPFSLLVLAAVTYNGISEVLLAIPSIRVWDIYRQGTEQHYIDDAVLYMSIGLLVMVACYLATGPRRAVAIARSNDVWTAARILDWRLLAIACAPLAVLTYEGRGYNNSFAPGTSTTATALAATFLIVLVSLATFGFLLRHGMRWFVLALAVQSIVLAGAGERLPLIAGAVALLILLANVGLRPSRRQVSVTVALTVLAVLGITGYRAGHGRTLYYQNSGINARIAAAGSGLYALVHTSDPTHANPGLIAQAAIRFDGNAFAGGVIQGMREGDPTLGAAPLAGSAFIVVPSIIWPSKLSHSADLNPGAAEIEDFHLREINYLPTFLGLDVGLVGPYWTVVLLAAIGALCGWGERWLFRSISSVRLVVLAAAVQASMSYEKGLPGMLVALRTAVVLAAAVWLTWTIQVRFDRRVHINAGNRVMVEP